MSGAGIPDIALDGAADLRLAVVASRWHDTVCEALLAGALRHVVVLQAGRELRQSASRFNLGRFSRHFHCLPLTRTAPPHVLPATVAASSIRLKRGPEPLLKPLSNQSGICFIAVNHNKKEMPVAGCLTLR